MMGYIMGCACFKGMKIIVLILVNKSFAHFLCSTVNVELYEKRKSFPLINSVIFESFTKLFFCDEDELSKALD